MPSSPRWTHIALPVRDLARSIEWYSTHTPLELLAQRHDDQGESAWLADAATGSAPFVLVLVSMDADRHEPPAATMAPFAHIGIELPSRAAVDEMAARGAEEGSLRWEAQELPEPVGYVCALADPDGNMVEFSFDQHVESIAREVWATGRIAGNGPRVDGPGAGAGTATASKAADDSR
ncbi:MAG: VOC family protein [Ilumatobacter sp.]|uniref:VOC family protein n=1 Tax=Ilumatobacter sp. TaxID=1967498 RepID=UPI0026182C54|nr:VOC family protein [Ilumatobacter sp.]MDJ0768195.1 VOC family protein [Ilumatobacter sp.]